MGNAERYRQLFRLSPVLLVLIVLLVLLIIIANGLINLLLYRALSADISLNEGIGLSAVNTLANQLPFAGGMIAKAVYLKRRYRMAYAHFFSATVALFLFMVAGSGLVGLLSLAYMRLVERVYIPHLLVVGFGALLCSLIVLRFPVDRIRGHSRLGRWLTELSRGWSVLQQYPLLVLRLTAIQILVILLTAGRLWAAFHALSQDVTLAQAILFAAAITLTQIVTITPGGLGVREALVGGLATVLGFELDVSVLAVAFERLISTTVILFIGTMYSYALSRKATLSDSSTWSLTARKRQRNGKKDS